MNMAVISILTIRYNQNKKYYYLYKKQPMLSQFLNSVVKDHYLLCQYTQPKK
jgi:hypothetical protein